MRRTPTCCDSGSHQRAFNSMQTLSIFYIYWFCTHVDTASRPPYMRAVFSY